MAGLRPGIDPLSGVPGIFHRLSAPRRFVIVAGIVLAAMVIAITVVALWVYRAAALTSAEWQLTNLGVVLSAQTQQAVLGIDLVVRETADDYRQHVVNKKPFPDWAFQRRLLARISQLSQVRSIVIVDSEGSLVVHSHLTPAPPTYYGDRDYFSAHREGRAAGFYVGEPVVARMMGGWTHTLSSRVEGPGGEFLGVVAAGVNIPYFHSLYEALTLGPGGRVLLFRRDGVLLTTYPPVEASLGPSFRNHDLFTRELPRADAGVMSGPAVLDGEPRLIAYRTIRDYPLVIAVTSTKAHILEQWWRQAWQVGMGALLGAALILAIAFWLAGRFRMEEALAEEARGADLRWLAALEAAGHGVWDWDVSAGRTMHSPQYHAILGYAANEIPSTPEGWLELLHPEDRKAMHQANRECLAGAVNGFSEEARLRCKDGGWKWVLNRGMAVRRDEHGRALRVLGTITDITEHREAQLRLAESEARLNAVIGSAMDAIITIDEHHDIVLFNGAAEKIFRCPRADAMGQPLDRFLPERFRAAHRRHIERFGATGVTMRQMGPRTVLYGLRSDGEEFPIDASISQVEVGGEKFFTVILRDITESHKTAQALEQSHRELQELYAVMHDVREAERMRVARELHDELAQWLTALKMDISWLAARLSRSEPRLADKAEKMKGVVDTTVAAVRRIAADLRPVMIDDLGLLPAVEHLLHDFSQRSGVAVSLDARADDIHFRDPLVTAMYRMVQEALTNVARHSGASHVEVCMACEGDELRVRVTDNGRGIDPGAPKKEKSFGLLGIQERARTLGGAARIYSPPAGGTVVEIAIPAVAYRRLESVA
jgi:PAS domain S-box-containing protein